MHGRPQKFFQGGQSRQFAYPFQVADDAMQMDVHKTLYPFYTTKKMTHVAATVANRVFLPRQFSPEQILVLVSIKILRIS